MEKVQAFVESGKPEDLEGCTRDQLKQIAEKCGIRLKASKVAGMKDEILRQLRARSEAAEQGAQEGAESRKEDDGQDDVRSQGSSRSSKSSRSSRSSRNRSLERFQLELQMQREDKERQFQLEKMKLELQMKNEAEKEKEKTRLEVERARLEVEKEKEKTRIRELELEQEKEKEKAQVEKEKAQVEKEKERTKQMQIEANRTLAEQRIEHGLPESTTQVSHSQDVRVREKDIPLFVPEEAESFFEHFEKVASIKEWPQEEWAQLVQLRLTGAAREAYTQLSLEECQDYATVKSSILRSFQLTPEAYRKRFREMIKVGACTFAETARDLERRFQKWIEAAGVGSYADLKQLMVMEKFLEMMHPETKFKIQEAGIMEVKDAADRADMITEAYKSLREKRVRSEARRSNGRSNGVWGGRNYERPRRVWGEKNFDKWADKSKYPKTQKSRSRTSSESEDGGAKRETDRYPGNQESSKAPQSAGSVPGSRNSYVSGQSQSRFGTYRRDVSQMRCYQCNGLGHVMRDCRQGKRVVTLAMCDPRSKYINVFRDKPQRANLVNERYRPFMSKGWISVGSQPEVEVGILRDTGANQSLIARSLIGDGRRLAGSGKVKVYGLLSESDMPVCTVQLRSEYVSAEVMLGVCPDIPIPGVQVILGNDLCGTKVLPRVIAETVPEECPEGHGTGGTPESVNLTDIRGDESGDRQAIENPVSVVTKAEVPDEGDTGEGETVSIQPVEDIDVLIFTVPEYLEFITVKHHVIDYTGSVTCVHRATEELVEELSLLFHKSKGPCVSSVSQH
ncbi:calponin homology domain-containing protein DDB_G0272472-like [Procambarus clarkii]|uniref:calponin homology domain-containing protein DDB_G0272472-like n=1 Tax=Procambarus clarkii TaxID=6728 RepID=UPI003743C37C